MDRMFAELDDARYCRYCTDGFLLVWYGGSQIHIFDLSGKEVEILTIGSLLADGMPAATSLEKVKTAMGEWISQPLVIVEA